MDIESLKKDIDQILSGNPEEDKPSLQELKDKDIAHTRIGTTFDLQEAHKIKNSRCERLFEIINDIKLIIEKEQYKNILTSTSGNLQSYFTNLINFDENVTEFIRAFKEDNLPTDELKSRRNGIIESYQNTDNFIVNNLEIQIVYNEIFKLKLTISEDDSISRQISELEASLKNAKKLEKEFSKINTNLRDIASETGTTHASTAFDNQIREHSKASKFWFGGFIVSIFALIATVVYIVCSEFNPEIYKLVSQVLQKLLLLTISGAFIKICLRKYNLERHLKVVYENRKSVLQQFKTFESSIGDNEEAKNKLRLAIANIIFSDPKTGLVDTDQNLSINPAVNLMENLSKNPKTSD